MITLIKLNKYHLVNKILLDFILYIILNLVKLIVKNLNLQKYNILILNVVILFKYFYLEYKRS